jgi:hypothetical protein
MSQSKRKSRRSTLRLESLEARNLLSLLITDKPTLEVQPAPPRVVRDHQGIRIIQPATIHVSGTAQPNVPGSAQSQIAIFAEDRDGSLVNNGLPLANATPDFLGRYQASFALPSTTRRDINFLVALESATGALHASVSSESTGISGLSGNLTINGTALNSLSGTLALDPGSPTSLTATATGTATASARTGAISNGAGAIGSATPGATASTQVDLTATATISNPPGTAARTGAISNGAGAIAPTTGTFTQIGSATLGATTSTQVTFIQEFAASDPVKVRIPQSFGLHFHSSDEIARVHGERVPQPRWSIAHQVIRGVDSNKSWGSFRERTRAERVQGSGGHDARGADHEPVHDRVFRVLARLLRKYTLRRLINLPRR